MAYLIFSILILFISVIIAFSKNLFKYFQTKNSPGNHRCWQCQLYDKHQGACLVIVYPRKAFVRTTPLTKCIWHQANALKNIKEFNVDKELYKVKKELLEEENSLKKPKLPI